MWNPKPRPFTPFQTQVLQLLQEILAAIIKLQPVKASKIGLKFGTPKHK